MSTGCRRLPAATDLLMELRGLFDVQGKKVRYRWTNEPKGYDWLLDVLGRVDQRLAAGAEANTGSWPPDLGVSSPDMKALAPGEREPNAFRERMSFERRMADQFAPPSTPQAVPVEQVIAEMRDEIRERRTEDMDVGLMADHHTADMLEDWADRLAAPSSEQPKDDANDR